MLLINPASEKFGGFLSRYVPIGIPVAVGSLAGYLRMHGVKVNVLDEEVTDITPESLAQALEGLEKPYVIGLSCLTAHVARAYEHANMIKRLYPDAVVVTGGLHASALPEESLAHDAIDAVIKGEGEVAILEFYRAVREGKPWEGIGNLSYRKNGVIQHNDEMPLVPDLDDLPMFPYDMFMHPRYEKGFITSSRGCPYKGVGWVDLPERWFLKPVELYHVMRVGLNVASNLLIAYLPLWLTQPLMHALNPALKERLPVPMEKEYKTVGWGCPPEHTLMSVINSQKGEQAVRPEKAPVLIRPDRKVTVNS